MALPDRIERTVELPHDRERVWAALTTAEGLGGWFGSSADVDLRPDGIAHVRWAEYDAEGTLRFTVVEPPERFAWSWGIEGLPKDDPRRTHVEFTLTSAGSGTRLTVVESGFAQLPEELRGKAYDGNVDGWRQELGELATWLDARAA